RLEAYLLELADAGFREVERLRRPLIETRIFKLGAVYLDQLIGLPFQFVDPRDDRAIGALGQSRDVFGREESVAAERFQNLNIAGHVRTCRDDLAVLRDGMSRPSGVSHACAGTRLRQVRNRQLCRTLFARNVRRSTAWKRASGVKFS